MLDVGDFKKARERISEVAINTPIKKSLFYSKKYNANVFLKMENLQTTGSFKIRGAFNKLSILKEKGFNETVVVFSAGNHAQGVAFSAKNLKLKSVIYMPENTPILKINKTKEYGAKVILHGKDFDEAKSEAQRFALEKGFQIIHPFDDEAIIAGQGTIAFEILENIKKIDILIIPIGGGGLISGIACLAKHLKPEIKIIGVQPKLKKGMFEAVKKNEVIYLASEEYSIADGTSVKKVGEITLEYTKKYVDEIVLIEEDLIKKTVYDLIFLEKIVVEGSGVLSVSALNKIETEGKDIVCLLSGGNIDPKLVQKIIKENL